MVGLPRRTRQQQAAAEPPLFDPAFRRRLEQMAIRTRQSMVWQGIGDLRSPRQSPSRELLDFRPYSQGEDLRYLDWNTYARLGELVTRLGQVSTDLTVHLLVDTSTSMNWGNPNKLRYAQRLAAALGYLSLWHFDRLVVAPFDQRLRAGSFGPQRGRTAIAPLFRYLEQLQASGSTDFARPLAEYVRRQQRRGVLLLISDLLTPEPGNPILALQPYLERGWDVVVFQVLDPQEVSPTYQGDFQLTDLEETTPGQLRISTDERAVAAYRAAFDRWLQLLEQTCAARRIHYLRLQTDWPFEQMVLRFLLADRVVGRRGARSDIAAAVLRS